MGKKAKNKGKTSRKLPVPSSPRSRANPKGDDPVVQAGDPCEHYEKGSAAVDRVLSRIRSASGDAVCEDCRDEHVVKVDGKGKGKGGRKKGGSGTVQSKSVSAPVTIWVCLDCCHFGCAGDADISKPYGHARRHHKQTKHVLAVKLDDPSVCWCFSCDSVMRIEVPEGVSAESKPAKGGDSLDSVDRVVEGGAEVESLNVDVGKGYAVRGLVNLGNTCFFNSIMQNLFAMDVVREYFSSSSEMPGPMTMALKKLFAETGFGMESSKGVVNPKNLFGCVCSKAPHFKGYQQQDSHELLRYLLDGLSTEEASTKKLLPSSDDDKTQIKLLSTFVDGLFGGQISSTVRCVECAHTSVVYEPFLDLSLPVPAKKSPSKKVAAAQPKKPKLPPSLRGRKPRERASTKLSITDQLKEDGVVESVGIGEQNAQDPTSSQSESNASYMTAANEQEEEEISLAGPDETWMDFIGPTFPTPDDLAMRDVEDMGVSVVKNGTPEIAQDPIFLEKSSGENAEVPQKVQDSVVLLPYKEEVASTSEQFYGPQNSSTYDVLADTAGAASSSSVGVEPSEGDFDGLGDLFAEPEVTSDLNKERNITEDQETSWFSGSGSESNQEEVDNSDAPVTVDSCLAYFIKPEFLSGEHAWHCENCSKILQLEYQKNREKAVARKLSDTSGAKINCDANTSNNAVSSLNGIAVDSAHLVLENAQQASSSQNKVYGSGGCGDTDSEVYGSVKLRDILEPSSMVENACQLNWNHSELARADVNQEYCSEAQLEDGDVADSGVSKYLTCSSSFNKEKCQIGPGDPDGGSCSNSKLNGDCYGFQDSMESSSACSDYIEENSLDNPGNDKYNNLRKGRKKGSKGLAKVHNNEESELQNLKVKRDATKRILVYKAPSILTIHLKRFSQDARGRLNKLNGHVSFEEMLDLAPYMDQSCHGSESYRYRLVGVVEHSGNMRGGHYIAYVRGQRGKGKVDDNGANKTWFYASDAHVREASLVEVLQSEAYILFYERVHP